mmetsp:Transcript_21290/g.42519  ORF Transcript_21290/g.42519 Transcript_21290/m.42519 type:complete len:215 (+) Transcript_21290:197-841(+)
MRSILILLLLLLGPVRFIHTMALSSPSISATSCIHIFPSFMSRDECSELIKKVSTISSFDNINQSNHVNYKTPDVSLLDHPNILKSLENVIWPNIFGLIKDTYGLRTPPRAPSSSLPPPSAPPGVSDLSSYVDPRSSPPLSFLDLFVVRYDPETFPSLTPHRDGSLLSFTVNLNDGWEGGGTSFNFLKSGSGRDREVDHFGASTPHHSTIYQSL